MRKDRSEPLLASAEMILRQPVNLMAEQAVRRLLELVTAGSNDELGRTHIFPRELIARESAEPPAYRPAPPAPYAHHATPTQEGPMQRRCA
jgi:hypothetical protein